MSTLAGNASAARGDPAALARARQKTCRSFLKPGQLPDYALIDSGNGRKLERYGQYLIERPEGQAIWQPSLPASEWAKADAVFTGNTEEEGMGRWQFPKKPLHETWPLKHDGMPFLGRFTSFRHVGVFPEQAAHWAYMQDLIRAANRPVKVLNLFGYTGHRHAAGRPRRGGGHPCGRVEKGGRLGAGKSGCCRAGRQADPLDCRGRDEICSARRPARQFLRHHPA